MRSSMSRLLKTCICLCLFAVFPAAAQAAVETVNFDGAQLNAPFEGEGKFTFSKGEGLRPYPVQVPANQAESGTQVADLGRCAEEAEAGQASGCEQFQAGTTVRLSETAKAVSVFAGRFGPTPPGTPLEEAVLTAFRADGTEVGAASKVIVAGGFHTELRVGCNCAVGDIAKFTIKAITLTPEGPSSFATDLGVDNVQADFATGAPEDFSLVTTSQVVPLVQGQQAQVPVAVPRINGSNGTITLSLSGLPSGVSAANVEAREGQQSAVLTITAQPFAADTHFQPIEATLTATPQNANVGPAPRSAPLSVRVAKDFSLGIEETNDENQGEEEAIPIALPDCAPLDLPLKVGRDLAMTQTVSLSAGEDAAPGSPLPEGIGAEFLPRPSVPPGGALLAERELRLRLGPDAKVGSPLPVTIVGRTPARGRELRLRVGRANPSATIADSNPGSGLGLTPRFGRPGTKVRVHGTGFCPQTRVSVGNEDAVADATLVDDHTIEFTVPRNATTGPVTVIPPGQTLGSYQTTDSLTVDSVRNTDGFAFPNYRFGSLSLDEMIEAFGADDLFIKINPCWPFGSCEVNTGVLNPMAAIDWLGFNTVAKLGAGAGQHCFGISRAVERFVAGNVPYRRFSAGAHSDFELAGPEGPSPALSSFLDSQQVSQLSSEYYTAFFHRPRAIQAQLDELERTFSHNREATVDLFEGLGGHAVLAYDMTQTPTTATIYVYENERPFVAVENSSPHFHSDQVEASEIRIDKVKGTWSLPSHNGDFTGGEGDLWVLPTGTVPNDPSLPSLSTAKEALSWVLFGSIDGAVRTVGDAAADAFLPFLTGSGGHGTGGSVIAEGSAKPLDVHFEGTGNGTYTQSYSAPGFVAGVAGVPTAKGVMDEVSGSDGSFSFRGGRSRPLRIQLAREESATKTVAASLATHASAGGADTASLDGDTLSYSHDGAPTTLRFSLTEVERDGGPASFDSGPIAVRRGDRLTARAVGRGLGRVRLTVRHVHGTTTRILRNRSHSRVAIGPAKLSGRRLSIRFRLHGLSRHAILGASLRLMDGHRLLARKAVALKGKGASRRLAWRLPKGVRPGRYELLADARAVAGSSLGSTATASAGGHRRATVVVKR